MRRSMEEQEQFYDDYWSPIEKNAGYDKQTNSYDVSPFIRDYLGIKERRLTAMSTSFIALATCSNTASGRVSYAMCARHSSAADCFSSMLFFPSKAYISAEWPVLSM